MIELLSSLFLVMLCVLFFGKKLKDKDQKLALLEQELDRNNQGKNDLDFLLNQLKNEIDYLTKENQKLQIKEVKYQTELQEHEKQYQEKLEIIQKSEQKLAETFKNLSSEALEKSQHTFLSMAQEKIDRFHEGAQMMFHEKNQKIDQTIQPLKEALGKVEQQIQLLEKSREGAYEGLKQQIRHLVDTQDKLHMETGNLVKALRAPQVRGRWGEMTLKRVVELAGMVEHCDFHEQTSMPTHEGLLRPDMIIHLPGEKQIVVDAKTPLQAYLNAIEEMDDQLKNEHLKHHARQMKEHLMKLSQKAYWEQFQPAPDFVVLFVPGESFFSAALKEDPTLVEQGVKRGIILATPTTLITLLKTVGFGWRQEKLAENSKEISLLGKDLYDRIVTFLGYFEKIGKSLENSVDSYNKATGSIESRVLVSVRKFQQLGISTKPIVDTKFIEKKPRPIHYDEIDQESSSSEKT